MKMASTPEQREKWKEQHRLRKLAKTKPNGDITSYRDSSGASWNIDVDVDWQHLPMEHAQTAYAELRKEFEKAGRILNERSMPADGHYTCFMCQITHAGDARGKDDAQEDPKTGLAVRVRICGEECWIAFQDFCIKTRAMRHSPMTKEQYISQYEELLSAMRKLRHLKMMKTA